MDAACRELLQAVVDVARAIFGAAASSVFLLDEEAGELVFQAVSGEGEEFLVGRRFPAGRGIAGWVAVSGEPMIVDDLTTSTAFDRALAESTAYVPDALMAAPLLSGGRVLGVLEVLDPSPQARSSVRELDLLAMFARQAAAALRVAVPDAGAGWPGPDGTGGVPGPLSGTAKGPVAGPAAGPAAAASALDSGRRADALRLLATLEEVLRGE
ncbi:GAF domain-containing protein [Streptomyces sp. LP05-1]|uniref:GAF domain-containing protein n=1 Tax=Streptomyces pyxinae TaxID=2970734 RepID=A0ABT2CH26_9ACTN|nr:GAF domain-containing protein [Streptomyces sp. LP05-1]MCS0636716.1 GAF domain-containing protein [Streptomyces sp. LP05-1]